MVRTGIFLLWFVVLAVSGCDGTGGEPQGTPCDPFALTVAPVTVSNLAIVAQADDGTWYVLDQHPDEAVLDRERLFVGRDGVLERVEIESAYWRLPLGPGKDGFVDWLDGGQGRTLQVEMALDGSTAVRYCPSTRAVREEAAGAGECTPLSVLDVSSVAGLAVKNLPKELRLEFVARADDGTTFVGTLPARDYTEASYRVFIGSPATMAEVPVVEVVRYTDGTTDYTVVYRGKERIVRIDRACPTGIDCGHDDVDEPQGCCLLTGSQLTRLELLDAGGPWGESKQVEASQFQFFCM